MNDKHLAIDQGIFVRHPVADGFDEVFEARKDVVYVLFRGPYFFVKARVSLHTSFLSLISRLLGDSVARLDWTYVGQGDCWVTEETGQSICPTGAPKRDLSNSQKQDEAKERTPTNSRNKDVTLNNDNDPHLSLRPDQTKAITVK